MTKRLDKERQQELEPKRMEYALRELQRMGFLLNHDDKKIWFNHLGNEITFYPYSGWHTGKSIKDGRGINNLLKQLKTG